MFFLWIPLALVAGQVPGLLQGVEPHLPKVRQGAGSLLPICKLWSSGRPLLGGPAHLTDGPALPLHPLRLVV